MSGSRKSISPLAERTPSQRISGWRVLGICLALAAISFAVFGQTLGHEFIDFDDSFDVYENPMVARGLSMQGLVWAFSFHSANWFPLTWLSHMLDCQLYGLRAGGHHLTNVVLHTASVIALFLILRRMTGALWRSAFVAAVFAVHPLRAESVAWVAERKDVLSGLFFMLTIGAYVRYAQKSQVRGSKSTVYYVLTLLFFALGLMCKPMLVTLPLILLLLDYWPLRRTASPAKLVTEKMPLLVLSVAGCIVTILAQHGAIESNASISAANRLGNAVASCVIYLRQMVWPTGLALLYPFPRNGIPLQELLLGVIILAALSAVAWMGRRTRPWLLMGWIWYLVMLLPVVGIIQVGAQAHADRYTYLPQIGIYMAVTWLLADWRISRVALGGLMAAVVAVLMACGWRQTAYWRNSETLWKRTLACTKENVVAHGNLGTVYREDGKVDDAIREFREALRIKPNDADNHNNLGTVLRQKGKVNEAISEYRLALQIKPSLAEAHYNLGLALLQKGKPALAIDQYEEALQIEPANTKVQNNLAWLLATCADASLRDGKKAVELAQHAVEPSGGRDPVILDTLAAALAEAGRFSDATKTAQKAMELARAAGKQDLVEELTGELKRYEAGLPCRP